MNFYKIFPEMVVKKISDIVCCQLAIFFILRNDNGHKSDDGRMKIQFLKTEGRKIIYYLLIKNFNQYFFLNWGIWYFLCEGDFSFDCVRKKNKICYYSQYMFRDIDYFYHCHDDLHLSHAASYFFYLNLEFR